MPPASTRTLRRAFVPLLALGLATTACSPNDYSRASVVQVTLADYRFDPSIIRLTAGKPIILQLTNKAEQPHEFAAPEFFTHASVRDSDAKSINGEGEAEVAPGAHVDIGLIPKAGTYHLQCNKPGHAKLGMQGTIIIVQ